MALPSHSESFAIGILGSENKMSVFALRLGLRDIVVQLTAGLLVKHEDISSLAKDTNSKLHISSNKDRITTPCSANQK